MQDPSRPSSAFRYPFHWGNLSVNPISKLFCLTSVPLAPLFVASNQNSIEVGRAQDVANPMKYGPIWWERILTALLYVGFRPES